MGLDLAKHRPGDVLAEGSHEGFDWVVMHNGIGYRCGYVRVPPGHPWHGEDYGVVDATVHGGLTYEGRDTEQGHCFGFDCAHAGDAKDPSLPGYKPPRPLAFLEFNADAHADDVIRTQEYVESECRSLCEQALAAARSSQLTRDN